MSITYPFTAMQPLVEQMSSKMPPTNRGGCLWGFNSSLPIYITIPQKGDKKRADFSTLTTDITLGNKLRNSHRDLLPNIDTAYFCNMGVENPHKHWVYAGPLAETEGFEPSSLKGHHDFESCPL